MIVQAKADLYPQNESGLRTGKIHLALRFMLHMPSASDRMSR